MLLVVYRRVIDRIWPVATVPPTGNDDLSLLADGCYVRVRLELGDVRQIGIGHALQGYFGARPSQWQVASDWSSLV